MTDTSPTTSLISRRFRGFLPIVVDFETGGFNCKTDALLEMAAVILKMDDDGTLRRGETVHCHVKPFEGANLEPAALQVTGIDPWHPFRFAVSEHDGLSEVFRLIRASMKKNACKRAIMVGHNTVMDLTFINAAAERCKLSRNPFHPFSTFDTVSLAGLAYGQTVLARAVQAAGIEWDNNSAHSGAYDALKTAELFCNIVNRWRKTNGMIWTTGSED